MIVVRVVNPSDPVIVVRVVNPSDCSEGCEPSVFSFNASCICGVEFMQSVILSTYSK